jgi:hypothetical protein
MNETPRGYWLVNMPVMTLLIGCLIAVTALLTLSATRSEARVIPTLTCPSPYEPHEVRVYGQRIESDINQNGSFHIVAQNDWADPKDKDPRYVVALVCTRSLNNSENNELFRWGPK